MDFKIKGNSFYTIKKVGNFVIKSSKTKDERLIKSIIKQKEFQSKNIFTPKIIDIDYNKTSFTMDYIDNIPFYEFFTYATKYDLDNFLEKIFNYFDEKIVGFELVSTDIFKSKLTSLNQNKFISLFDDIEKIKVYKGQCHGDLTFSNILITDKIFFIDFLDSYIESPTMDLVKLRQDTHLKWFLNKIENKKNIDNVKLQLSLNYLDKRINEKFRIENYEHLQIINLLRIYPYSLNNKKIISYLDYNIKKLCETL